MAFIALVAPIFVATVDVLAFIAFGGDVGAMLALRERYVVHEYGDLVLGRWYMGAEGYDICGCAAETLLE